jgi:DNA-binding IclR family transcriptional regulator
MPSREKESYCIRSVENALLLLEALAEEDSKCSLSQLSQRLGMTKASLFRLMATFESHGYVERNQGASEYNLGMAAFEVGQKLLSRMPLLRMARPVMEQLVRNCNETAYLVVQRNQEALFLAMSEADQKVKIVSLVGRRFPLQDCAAGKIFLAFDTQNNKKLIEDEAHLSTAIMEWQQEGVCLDHNGIGEGCTCIAVPLLNSDNQLVGCLSLVGPSFRMGDEQSTKRLIPAIKAAGVTISAKLGHLNFQLKSVTTALPPDVLSLSK